MGNWEHVDKEEVIISEEGLDEAIHNAYLKGRNDVLEKISVEIERERKSPFRTDEEDEGLRIALAIISGHEVHHDL